MEADPFRVFRRCEFQFALYIARFEVPLEELCPELWLTFFFLVDYLLYIYIADQRVKHILEPLHVIGELQPLMQAISSILAF